MGYCPVGGWWLGRVTVLPALVAVLPVILRPLFRVFVVRARLKRWRVAVRCVSAYGILEAFNLSARYPVR